MMLVIIIFVFLVYRYFMLLIRHPDKGGSSTRYSYSPHPQNKPKLNESKNKMSVSYTHLTLPTIRLV